MLDDLTVACEDRDFVEWHGGHRHAAVWAFELDLPEVRSLLGAASDRLGSLLLPRYDRQPHVTVSFAGLVSPTDFTDARLDADLAILRTLSRGPVKLTATGWDSFPMVPYLRVDADWAHVAREALSVGRPDAARTYQPHVTVGLYGVSLPIVDAIRRMAGLPFVGAWELDELSLLRYETADVAGPLEVLGRLDLTTGSYRRSRSS